MSKLENKEGSESDGDDAQANDKDSKIKAKKIKNLKKMMDYHQRKRREFYQREPIPLDGTSIVP